MTFIMIYPLLKGKELIFQVSRFVSVAPSIILIYITNQTVQHQKEKLSRMQFMRSVMDCLRLAIAPLAGLRYVFVKNQLFLLMKE